MAKAKGKIRLRGRFPAGAKVELFRRVGQGAVSGKAVKSATVSKDSVLEFDGLEPWEQFFAVATIDGARRRVAVTAKPTDLGHPDLANTRAESQARLLAQAEARAKQAAAARKDDPLAGSPAPGGPDESRQIVEGSRGTGSTRRHPAPAPKQEDVPEGVKQRSATRTGEAVPVADGELRPEVPQSEVPEGTPQRSDTEAGSAAIVPDGEVRPSLKQEDVPDGTGQRSATPEGEAEPVPNEDPVAAKERRDGSQARAEGETPQKPREKRVKGEAKKSSSGRSRSRKSGSKKSAAEKKAARSRAAKKAAATRKRNARKGR